MVLIAFYVVLAASLFFVSSLWYHIAVATSVSLFLLFIPFQRVRGGFIPICLFLFFTFCGNLFFHHGRILYGSGILTVTDEGVAVAYIRTLRVFSMIYGAKILTSLLSVEEMISAMDRLLRPLERTGIPVKEFFAIMGLTMKSFPLLTAHLSRTYREERESRNIRGFRNRTRHMATFMMPVFIESIRTPERFFVGEREETG